MQAHTEGSAVLPLQVGANARAALQSCDLAAAGFPGLAAPRSPAASATCRKFEGDWDLEPALPGSADLAGGGAEPQALSGGRATHGGIEGLMALRDAAGFGPDEVAEVVGPARR